MSSDNPKVRHAPIKPFDYGTLREDAATFYVNNKVYEGFKNIMISRNLTSLTGTFQITLTDKTNVESEDFEIKSGDRIHCHLGKEALYEGYVDKITISVTPTSRNITIVGRDKTADLVDCSILGNNEFNDVTFTELATAICKPFDIKVLPQVDVGNKFAKFTVRQGETVFEALERAAKERKLLLLSSTHGNLVIDRKGKTRASSEIIEGVNFQSGSVTFDDSERFSEYTVKGQNTGLVGEILDSTGNKGIAYDNGIKRYRPVLVIAENSVDNDGAQKRAEFEANFRAAKAAQINCVVIGWKQKNGKLWATNQTVHLDAKSLGVKQDFLIQRVKFNQGDKGRRTEIELIRPDAFEFKTTIEEKDDPLASFGLDEKK